MSAPLPPLTISIAALRVLGPNVIDRRLNQVTIKHLDAAAEEAGNRPATRHESSIIGALFRALQSHDEQTNFSRMTLLLELQVRCPRGKQSAGAIGYGNGSLPVPVLRRVEVLRIDDEHFD